MFRLRSCHVVFSTCSASHHVQRNIDGFWLLRSDDQSQEVKTEHGQRRNTTCVRKNNDRWHESFCGRDNVSRFWCGLRGGEGGGVLIQFLLERQFSEHRPHKLSDSKHCLSEPVVLVFSCIKEVKKGCSTPRLRIQFSG